MSEPVPFAELANDEVRVAVHRKKGCGVELHTFAFPPLMQTAKKAAIRSLNKEVSLPGFRKGKAPDEWILKKFPNDVEKNFHKELANLAYTAAQKLVQIPLLNNKAQISFEVKKESEEGVELLFAFETDPTVPPIDPQLFQAKPVERVEVGEKQVEEAIRQMRFFYANWTPVTERAIQDGDYILISLETFSGGVPEKVFDHIRFEVSQERMAQWMKQLVQGAKAGDVLEGMSEADADASEEEKKTFQPKRVRLTIHKVEEAHLPELNDEFAKKIGSADIPAMRTFILSILNEKAEEKVREELRDQVNAFLSTTYSFDLPESLVETEKEDRIQQSLLEPQAKEKWNSLPLVERQTIEERHRQEAVQAIRLFYLSRQVVNDAKIPITQEEVQQEAVSLLHALSGGKKIDTIPKEVYALALSRTLLAKAQDYILKQSQKA